MPKENSRSAGASNRLVTGNIFLGEIAFFTDHYPEAQEQIARAIKLLPEIEGGYALMGMIKEKQQDFLGALEWFRQGELASADQLATATPELDRQCNAYLIAGRDGYWQEKVERAVESGWRALDIAETYANAGDKENALKYLEKADLIENAFEQRREELLGFNVFPCWEILRPDPRFIVYLNRMGFSK
jgi:tetratricopeptide (TPR) repeat protein